MELAGARWLFCVSAFLVIGGSAASWVIGGVTTTPTTSVRRELLARVRRARLLASIALLAGSAASLIAQLHAWFGPDGITREYAYLVITSTPWGIGWAHAAWIVMAMCAGAVAAVAWSTLDRTVAVGALMGGATAVTLTGHGATHGTTVWLLQIAHVLGGGLWLGTLAIVLHTTWPLWRAEASGREALRAVLMRFTPAALVGACLSVASGVALTVEQIPSVARLTSSSYGRVLIAKTAVVMLVAGLGWFNWKGVRASGFLIPARTQVRTLAVIETAVALLVVMGLAVWLSQLPMPRMRGHAH